MSHNYSSDKYYQDNFDYETAKMDLFDAGVDPDYLSSYDREKRDEFLRKQGLNPREYGSRYEKPSSSGSSSDDGCFLTTACVSAKQLPDDCDELQTLRAYRDGYLKSRENGPEDIAEYYSCAPGIVKNINALPEADQIWTKLYESLVLPCVAFIKAGENEKAYRLYKETTLSLKEEYGA